MLMLLRLSKAKEGEASTNRSTRLGSSSSSLPTLVTGICFWSNLKSMVVEILVRIIAYQTLSQYVRIPEGHALR